MPCNIGYKSYVKVEIPAPVPEKFSAKSEAPQVDADLLEKLGVEDPEFVDWARQLDSRPLLEAALERALANTDAGGVTFMVDAAKMLSAKGSFTSPAEKKKLEAATDKVTSRWQMETLGIVAELLDYSVTITEKGDTLTLEAEEASKSHPCDYIKVTKSGEKAEVTFEHFKSREKLDLETAKFATLAEKLGVKIALTGRKVTEGDPFPSEVLSGEEHTHAHKHGLAHSHDHDHDHEH